MRLSPYIVCKGRKFKKEKLKKLIRPICINKRSILNNYNFTEKDKIRFITQLFRWFRKDSRHYRIYFFLKKKYVISNFDFINLTVKIQKAGWKKLLNKLNYYIKDYKELKRRSYSLNFKFFFINIEDNKNKEITIDISSKGYDIFDIFITTNAYYIEEFYNIINTLNKKVTKKFDENDYLLYDLDYIYTWHRANKIIGCDVYMSWYLTKEEYSMYRQYKRSFERKYFCTIKERKLNSVFPLKNVKGHLVVADKKERNRKLNYWKTWLINDSFRRKEDLFEELKKCINRINRIYKVNTILVYFFLEFIDK